MCAQSEALKQQERYSYFVLYETDDSHYAVVSPCSHGSKHSVEAACFLSECMSKTSGVNIGDTF